MDNYFKGLVPKTITRNLSQTPNRNTNRGSRGNGQSSHGNMRGSRGNVRVLENPVYQSPTNEQHSQGLNLPLETDSKSENTFDTGSLNRLPESPNYYDRENGYYERYSGYNVQGQVGRQPSHQYNNGRPYVGDIISNELPALQARNIPDSVNYYWRIGGLTECSRTCGEGMYI